MFYALIELVFMRVAAPLFSRQRLISVLAAVFGHLSYRLLSMTCSPQLQGAPHIRRMPDLIPYRLAQLPSTGH